MSPTPEERWVDLTFTARLDVGWYGSVPDGEDIAYLLNMGGIHCMAARAVSPPEEPARCPAIHSVWAHKPRCERRVGHSGPHEWHSQPKVHRWSSPVVPLSQEPPNAE